MKLQLLKDQIEDIIKKHPDAIDYEVYIEDEDLYTVGSKLLAENGYPEELIEHNRKTVRKIKNESKIGWKFFKAKSSMARNDETDAYDYYKECAGGVAAVPERRAILININY